MTLVLVLVGNKSDNYLKEVVTNDEGKALAKEINAIYLRTSAKSNISIDEIFINIGKKFINPDYEITTSLTKEEIIQKTEQLRRETIKKELRKKKKCC